ADERHARIETIVENPDGLTMYVDGMLIIQALTNLVINAITYSTESSQVTISISVNERHTVISVSDFGCGIPKEAQERIFERFYRVDTARSRRQGGTGLGLSIVKHIVQVHNGSVSVESEVGVGSTFTITLPTDGAEMKRYKTAQTGR
ncbi:MAG: ATP-binding protein, partial [Sphaerochaetaceae bacterium]|nr:ATP-binding protein [Sphaerochaetaceae bacterium]